MSFNDAIRNELNMERSVYLWLRDCFTSYKVRYFDKVKHFCEWNSNISYWDLCKI